MDEEIERLVVSVRADTAVFAGDVAQLRGQLEGPLGAGAARAGQAIETALARAIRTGKLGFDDLGRVALSVMGQIASAAVSGGIGSLFGGGGSGGSLIAAGTKLLGAALGLPGRATGGPVAPGRAYVVGERGPELFVPTGSGQIHSSAGNGARDVRVTINLNAPAGSEAQALARSSRQMARAVRDALERAGD